MTIFKQEIQNFSVVQEAFVKDIVREILPEQNTPQTKVLCFKFRFNPQHFNLKHKSSICDETTIASMIKQELNGGFSNDSINQYIKDICTTIQNHYQTEISEYVNNKSDLNGETWRWEELYNWLWNDKFPRWFWFNKLVKLVEPNKKYFDWISFMLRVDSQRGIAGKPRHSPATLPLNVDGHFYITINYSDCYLLLLNLGADRKNINLICPSEAFSPSYFVKGHEILIPSLQGNSDYGTINFEQEGEEEFIAIVLKQPLNFPWLDRDRENSIPILEQNKIKDLWNFLINNDDWEIFHKSFKVV